MNFIETFTCHILLAVVSIVFIYNSIILFTRGKYNRPRQMLGITMLIWGVMYLIYLFGSIYGQISYPVFCAEALFSSHLFICLMFLFPYEILVPGWLNLKRGLIMLIPITLLAVIYYIGLKLTDEHIEEFFTFTDLFNSFNHFNVWFRCVVFFFNLVFIFILIQLLTQRANKYIKWQSENFSDLDDIDISWMNYYYKMMIVISLCYIVVAIWGARISIMIHTFVIAVSFCILFYKALFFESKYAVEEEEEVLTDPAIQLESCCDEEEFSSDIQDIVSKEHSFEAKMPIYVETLKKWLEEEKPFLYKDFKLADITRILPLNRSYLSRVINEGFQQNFSELVRFYRIETAKQLLVEHADLPIHRIAEMCGFASDSTFNKAFQVIAGCTPKHYRDKNKK